MDEMTVPSLDTARLGTRPIGEAVQMKRMLIGICLRSVWCVVLWRVRADRRLQD